MLAPAWPRRTTVPSLLPVLVATLIGPSPPPPALPVHDLATLPDAQARRLAGRHALFRVVLDGEPDGDEEHGWTYDCQGQGGELRTLWLPDGDDLVAYEASRGSGLLVVEATLRRIVHRPVTGADGSRLPALIEYRQTGARVVDRPER
jgi:hypothetical protein